MYSNFLERKYTASGFEYQRIDSRWYRASGHWGRRHAVGRRSSRIRDCAVSEAAVAHSGLEAQRRPRSDRRSLTPR